MLVTRKLCYPVLCCETVRLFHKTSMCFVSCEHACHLRLRVRCLGRRACYAVLVSMTAMTDAMVLHSKFFCRV